MTDIASELHMPQATFYRIINAIRQADIGIEGEFLPEGKKGLYLPRQKQTLLDRILREE